MSNTIRMEMRTAERRPICDFQLVEGETLSERVAKEIKEASERGDINSMGVKATIPPIAVFAVNEDGDGAADSIALFSATGVEVSNRDYRIAIGTDKEGRDVVRVDVTDQVEKDGSLEETSEVLGVFYSEDTARRVGSLWKAGALD